MAFKDIDQRLINECSQNKIDIDKIKVLIEHGANINAFDEEYGLEVCIGVSSVKNTSGRSNGRSPYTSSVDTWW